MAKRRQFNGDRWVAVVFFDLQRAIQRFFANLRIPRFEGVYAAIPQKQIRMAEGYDGEQAAPLDEGMDEFLCEYVDGVMDPVVLRAFEEYLRANPEMAAHAQCLCQAKRLLSQQCACHHGTNALQQNLRIAIAREQLGNSAGSMASGLGSFAWVTSAAGLMLILGMVFGTAVTTYQSGGSAGQAYMERESAPSDAHPMRTARLPLGSRATFGVAGPVMALPTLSSSSQMTLVTWADSLSYVVANP
ncbi:MAG: hypothetical protein ACI80V_003588 [Rhodothermales bacterium]